MSNDATVQHPASWFAARPGDDLSGHEPNRLWLLHDSGRYEDVAAAAGVASTVPARGIAFGDVDSDGRVDAVVANQWAPSDLLLNASTAGGHLTVQVKVAGTNGGLRDAVGAGVTLTSPGAPTQYRQLFPANGHAGVSAAELHFGLGADQARALDLTVRWRDGGGQHTAPVVVAPGRVTLILSDDGEVRTSP